MAIAQIVDTPSVAQFRGNLPRYFEAAEAGRQFQIIRYRTPIAVLGPIKHMPPKYRKGAQLLDAAQARDDFPSLTQDVLLKKSGIVIRKLVKGPNTLPKKGGRRRPIARDYKEIVGLWPITDPSMSDLVKEVRDLHHMVSILNDEIMSMGSSLSLVAGKLKEITRLDEEIEAKRKVSENLDRTIRRLGGDS